jgi:hypothetical protein
MEMAYSLLLLNYKILIDLYSNEVDRRLKVKPQMFGVVEIAILEQYPTAHESDNLDFDEDSMRDQ